MGAVSSQTPRDPSPLPLSRLEPQAVPQIRRPIMLNAPDAAHAPAGSGVKASTSDPRDLAGKAKSTTTQARSVRKSMPAAALASVFARATLRKSRRLTKAAPPASPPKGSPKRSSPASTPSRTQKRTAKTKSATTPARALSLRKEEVVPPMPTAPVPAVATPPPLVPVPSPLLAPAMIASATPSSRSPLPIVAEPRSVQPSPLALSPCPTPTPMASYSRAPSPFLQQPMPASHSSTQAPQPQAQPRPSDAASDKARTIARASHLQAALPAQIAQLARSAHTLNVQRSVPSAVVQQETSSKVAQPTASAMRVPSPAGTERAVTCATQSPASEVPASSPVPDSQSQFQALPVAVEVVPAAQPAPRRLAPPTGLAIQMPSADRFPQASISASGHLSPRPAYARPRSPSPSLSSTPTIPPPSPQADAPYLELARRAHHARHSSWQIACRLVSRAEEALENHLWSGRDPETAVIRLRIAKEEEEKCRKKVDDAALVLIRLRRGDGQERKQHQKSTAPRSGHTSIQQARPVTQAVTTAYPAPRQPLAAKRPVQQPREPVRDVDTGDVAAKTQEAAVFRPLSIIKTVRSPQLPTSPVETQSVQPTLRRQSSLKRPSAPPRTSSCPTPEILPLPRVPPVPQVPGNYHADLQASKDARLVVAPPLLRARSVHVPSRAEPESRTRPTDGQAKKCDTCQGMCLCSAISGWMY